MKRRICAGVVMVAACAAASVLVPAPFAGARETMRERLRDRIAERLGADNAAKVPGHETISYGRDRSRRSTSGVRKARRDRRR